MADRLHIVCKTPDTLSQNEQDVWQDLRAQNAALYSPYFHLEYSEIIHALCKNVTIAVIREHAHSDPIGFFAYQRTRGGFARPVGAPMTDYCGIICAPNTTLALPTLLRALKIGAFNFRSFVDPYTCHLTPPQSPLDYTVMDIGPSPQIWREGRDNSYRRHLKSHRRRVRKAQDIQGEPRCDFASTDPKLFDLLMKWKSAQFARTGKYNVLGVDWTYNLIQRLWAQTDKTQLHADMHVLFFGERPAAIDLGLSDGGTFHSWMIGYDPELHTFAPGIQLLEALIDAAPDLGYSRLDLGEGTDGYKRHYASVDISAYAGFQTGHGAAAAWTQAYRAGEKWGERLGGIGKLPGKLRRRYSQIAACDPRTGAQMKALIQAITGNGKA